MIEGRVWCDKCGESEPLEALQVSYNEIKFSNFEKYMEYSLKLTNSATYKNILICKKCQEGLQAVLDQARDAFFKEIK